MAQFNPKEFVYHYRNGKPAYYSYDGELYCGTFPEEWVLDNLPDTGPRECKNCQHYGSWNGVFLGYCANCARLVYNGERGYGFIDVGRECDYIRDVDGASVFDTYLKDVLPDEVGDKDFMDSAALQDFQSPPDENGLENLSFEEKYPDIDIDEVNAYYDECEALEEVTYSLEYVGGGTCGSDYDGGYDSY